MRTKKAFVVKLKAVFIIFKGLSIANNCPRPKSGPLSMYELLLPPDFKGLKMIWIIPLIFADHSQKASVLFYFKNQ